VSVPLLPVIDSGVRAVARETTIGPGTPTVPGHRETPTARRLARQGATSVWTGPGSALTGSRSRCAR